MLTSWGKGCLNSSQLCVLTRRNSERPLCSLHLSKQAAFLEPGQLDDLLILGKKKKSETKADCIRHLCARCNAKAITNPYVCDAQILRVWMDALVLGIGEWM